MNAEIRNPSAEKLDYAFHAPSDATQERIVLIGHGVTGNKDRPWAQGLADALASAGIPALRFSFAGNGDSEGAFTDCTVSKEVEDLGAVLDAAAAAGYQQLIYAGHSMGGAVGVLRASTDARIHQLISLAGMVHTRKFCDTEFGEETPDEGCMWEDEDCPLSQTFVDDMHRIDSVLHLTPSIRVPWLFVHGDEDDVVPVTEGREMFAAANEPKKWVEIPGGDHVFSGDALKPMTDAVVQAVSLR